jgi:pseudouridine kinase
LRGEGVDQGHVRHRDHHFATLVEHRGVGAARDGAPLVVVAVSEPKMSRLPQDLRGLRLLILNEGELAARAGGGLDIAAACAVVQAQGAQDLIVTRGAAGVCYTSAGSVRHLAAPHADVVDVTGAGDAFAAAVCWSLFHGSDDLEAACRRGLKLSGMTLACAQTVCPYLSADSLEDAAASQPLNTLYQE